MNEEAKKQVAVITGASRGIGKAIALDLAEYGCDIVGISRSQQSASMIAPEIEARGARYLGLGVDVSSSEAVEEATRKILNEWKHIDILVNNAGITRDMLMMRMSDEDWNTVLQTNLSGAFFWIKSVLRPMMKNRSGRIINMSSVIGLHGNAGQANYAAAKAGLLGLTQSVAKECASRGITCNAVCPGFIETDMTDGLDEALKTELLNRIPLKRLGKPEDVAALTRFLCTPEAGYITGQALTIDAGLFI